MAHLMLASPGSPLDDEIAHFLIAERAATDPASLVSVWGRLGNTLFYLLPSQFDLEARRLWAFGTTLLVVWIAARAGRRMGVRHDWLIALGCFLQPWYAQLGFTSITQIPFMLLLILAVERWSAGHLLAASLCFGLLPIIRHEGVALTGAWLGMLALWALNTRLRVVGLRCPVGVLEFIINAALAGAPLLIWNIVHFAVTGAPASSLLAHPFPTNLYGSGSWFHFVSPTFDNVGGTVLLLGGIGLCASSSRDWRVAAYMAPAFLYYAVHTVLFRAGAFASGGYPLFLLPIAPFAAIACAQGIEVLAGLPGSRLKNNLRIPALAVTVAATIACATGAVVAASPWTMNELERAAFQTSEWMSRHTNVNATVYSTYVWFIWRHRDVAPIHKVDSRTLIKPEDLATGDYLVWDSKYGNLNGIPLNKLRDADTQFKEIESFGPDLLVVFQKR